MVSYNRPPEQEAPGRVGTRSPHRPELVRLCFRGVMAGPAGYPHPKALGGVWRPFVPPTRDGPRPSYDELLIAALVPAER